MNIKPTIIFDDPGFLATTVLLGGDVFLLRMLALSSFCWSPVHTWQSSHSPRHLAMLARPAIFIIGGEVENVAWPQSSKHLEDVDDLGEVIDVPV